MTPEELRLYEIAQAQAAAQQQAAQDAQAAMESNARQIQDDISRREQALSGVGFPPEPYLPHSYSAPGIQLGDRISAFGRDASQTVGNIADATVQNVQNIASGVVGGMGHLMSDIGSLVRPIFKTPTMGVAVGYGGYHVQSQGFFSSLAGSMGLGDSPDYLMNREYRAALASDAGERLGYGTAAAVGAGAGFAASMYAMKIPGVGAAGAGIGKAAGGLIGLGGAGAKIGRFAASWLAAPLLAYDAASSITDAVAARRETSGFLEASSFRFAGAGSKMMDPRMGRGISREGRREVAEYIRGLDIEDSLLRGEDLTTILQEGTRYGLFEGAGGDLDKFKKKFKEIKDGVREMAKVLNVSLEEGLATMKEIYSAGVDPTRAVEVASIASATGRVAGRTGSEMLTLGLQGAEQFRGTGVSMEIGMRGAMMNLSAIRAARDAGLISKEAIEQAGGEEALALRRVQRQVQFAQSGEGRAFMASFFDPQAGGVNQAAFEAAISGSKDISELAQDAARNLNDPSKLIKFESQQEQMASEMGKAFGGRGLQFSQWGLAMAEATYMARHTGATTEDSFRAIMLRKGISPQELEAIQGEMKGAMNVFGASQKGAAQERDRLASEEAERNKLFFQIKERLSDVASVLTDLVAKPLTALVDKIAAGVENLSDKFEGAVVGDVSKIPTAATGGISDATVTTGPTVAQERKKELFSAKDGAMARDSTVSAAIEKSKVLDMTRGAYWGFGPSAGGNLIDAAESGAFGGDLKDALVTVAPKDRSKLAVVTGELLVWQGQGEGSKVMGYQGFYPETMEKFQRRGDILGMSDEALEQMDKAGRLDNLFQTRGGESLNIRSAIGNMVTKLDPTADLDVTINKILQESGATGADGTLLTLDKLTRDQGAAIVKQLRTLPAFKERFKEARGALTKLQSGIEVGQAATYETLAEGYKALQDKIKDKYDVKLSPEAAGRLTSLLAVRENIQGYATEATRLRDLASGAKTEKDRDQYMAQAKEMDARRVELGKSLEEAAGSLMMDVLPSLEGDVIKERGLRNLIWDVTSDNRGALTPAEIAQKKGRISELYKLTSEASGEERIKLNNERIFLEAELRGAGGGGMIADIALMSRALYDRQREMAKNLYGNILTRELITNKDLTEETVSQTRDLIGNILDRPESSAQTLSDPEKELLGKTKTGQFFLAESERISLLQQKITNLKASGEDVTESTFVDIYGERGKKLYESFTTSGDLAVAMSGAFEELVSSTVGVQKRSQAGYTTDTAMQSSTELFYLMTQANTATLNVLQEMYGRLKRGE